MKKPTLSTILTGGSLVLALAVLGAPALAQEADAAENQTQAAKLLKITRDTLRYKMKKLKLR